MYTNGNLDAHLAALLFLGMLALTVALVIATVVLFFRGRPLARYTLLATGVLLASYAAALGLFSWASYDRTVKRGDEKFFCGLDCHIAYSVQNVERIKTIGAATPRGEFVLVTLRSHFDERTIAPWRGNGALKPDPPVLELVDASGRHFPISLPGQRAWEEANASSHSLSDPLRPGESYETTWVFEVSADSQSVRTVCRLARLPGVLADRR